MTHVRESVKFTLVEKIAPVFGWNINPNYISVLGPIFAILSGIALYNQYLFLSFVFFIGLCTSDIVDGAIARSNDITSNFGTIIDGLADRTTDVLLIGSFTIAGILSEFQGLLMLALLLLIPYVRASFERFRISIPYGKIERLEFLIFITCSYVLLFAHLLTLLAILIWIFIAIGYVSLFDRFYTGTKLYQENLANPVPLDPEETTYEADDSMRYEAYAS